MNAIASGWFSPSSVFRFWIVSVFVNSLYSFWWDVTNDWGLALLAPSAHSSTSNFKRSAASVGSQSRYQVGVSLLRPSTLLSDPWIYYAAIAIDLLLRLTWSFKLSLHLHAIHEIEQGIYLMEALEVLRRWMWTFIRIEWETIKKVESHHPSRSSTHSHASQENTMVLSDRAHTTAHKDPSGLGISGIEYTHDSAV